MRVTAMRAASYGAFSKPPYDNFMITFMPKSPQGKKKAQPVRWAELVFRGGMYET